MASQSTNQGNGLNFAEKCMLNLSTCDPMKFKFSSVTAQYYVILVNFTITTIDMGCRASPKEKLPFFPMKQTYIFFFPEKDVHFLPSLPYE